MNNYILKFFSPRICTIKGFDYTNTCRQIAQLDDIKKDAYSNIDDVSGVCQSVFVELLLDILDAIKMTQGKAKIVLCDIGPDNKKCASASTNENVIEYYDYNTSNGICVHISSMNLNGSTSIPMVEDMGDTSTHQYLTKKEQEGWKERKHKYLKLICRIQS